MNSKKTRIFLAVLITLGSVGYFLATMKNFADGGIEDSQRIEELKKTGDFDEPINISEDSIQQVASDSTQEANSAKEWLTTTIVKFFSQNSRQHFRDITTERYAQYKQDVLCVVYDCDNSLTEEEFEQKWSNTYGISYAGFGESFLTDQQDLGNILMPKCELTSQSEPATFVLIPGCQIKPDLLQLRYIQTLLGHNM